MAGDQHRKPRTRPKGPQPRFACHQRCGANQIGAAVSGSVAAPIARMRLGSRRGTSRKSRQQDNLSDHRCPVRRPAWRSELRIGIAGKIRALLLRDIANPPTFAAVAGFLGADARSLRRQLRRRGPFFSRFAGRTSNANRSEISRTTKLANELVLGFSDAANLRRAFHRWAKRASSEIRGE